MRLTKHIPNIIVEKSALSKVSRELMGMINKNLFLGEA